MKRGKIDVAITLLEQNLVQPNIVPIYKEGYRIMLPSKHKLAERASLDVHELAEETMIARRSCEILSETSRFFTQRGIRPIFGLRSTNDDRCMEMVKAGLGVTTAPLSLAREGVTAVAIAGYNFERCIGLKFSASMEMGSETASALVDICRDASPQSSKDVLLLV
jgi:DNA-binding transcriptional LysR family regulator